MDAVAPETRTSFSPDRLRSTYAHIAVRYRICLRGGGANTHFKKRCCGPSL